MTFGHTPHNSPNGCPLQDGRQLAIYPHLNGATFDGSGNMTAGSIQWYAAYSSDGGSTWSGDASPIFTQNYNSAPNFNVGTNDCFYGSTGYIDSWANPRQLSNGTVVVTFLNGANHIANYTYCITGSYTANSPVTWGSAAQIATPSGWQADPAGFGISVTGPVVEITGTGVSPNPVAAPFYGVAAGDTAPSNGFVVSYDSCTTWGSPAQVTSPAALQGRGFNDPMGMWDAVSQTLILFSAYDSSEGGGNNEMARMWRFPGYSQLNNSWTNFPNSRSGLIQPLDVRRRVPVLSLGLHGEGMRMVDAGNGQWLLVCHQATAVDNFKTVWTASRDRGRNFLPPQTLEANTANPFCPWSYTLGGASFVVGLSWTAGTVTRYSWQVGAGGSFAASIGQTLAAIGAKTNLLGSATVAVNSPATASGAIFIFRGRDHRARDGQAWTFADPGTWPSLAGAASITLTARQIGDNNDPAPLILTGSVAAGPPQVVAFEASAAVTGALTPSQSSGDYTFDVVAVLANGDAVCLVPEGSATVVPNVGGTGLPVGQPTPVSLAAPFAGGTW